MIIGPPFTIDSNLNRRLRDYEVSSINFFLPFLFHVISHADRRCSVGGIMNGALAGLVILVLGDSHMAGPSYLISTLHEALEAQGATVSSYGMCGASADA